MEAVYGSAKKHSFKELDPIYHQCLGIALGAFLTSLTLSLYEEERELSPEHQIVKLSMNHFLKIKSLPENPCFDPVTELFESPVGACIPLHIQKRDIDQFELLLIGTRTIVYLISIIINF